MVYDLSDPKERKRAWNHYLWQDHGVLHVRQLDAENPLACCGGEALGLLCDSLDGLQCPGDALGNALGQCGGLHAVWCLDEKGIVEGFAKAGKRVADRRLRD